MRARVQLQRAKTVHWSSGNRFGDWNVEWGVGGYSFAKQRRNRRQAPALEVPRFDQVGWQPKTHGVKIYFGGLFERIQGRVEVKR